MDRNSLIELLLFVLAHQYVPVIFKNPIMNLREKGEYLSLA